MDKKEKELKESAGIYNVSCPECGHVFEIGGNDLEIECEECGFTGDQNDFEDSEEEAD